MIEAIGWLTVTVIIIIISKIIAKKLFPNDWRNDDDFWLK
tara:strand:- start:261 stop:380 length:120 start_codon:yes stop_codon:yes gene_type:complete